MSRNILIAEKDDLSLIEIQKNFLEICKASDLIIIQEKDEIIDCLNKNEEKIVFIRIDDVKSKGLELTRLIKKNFLKVKVVWTAYSENYAISAFDETVDGFILLPFTKEKLLEVMRRLEGIDFQLHNAINF